MKKTVAWLVVFFISFFTALFFLLPYKNIYDNLIDKYAQTAQLQVTYNITNASLFSLSADKVSINKGDYIVHFDKTKVELYPLNYLLGGDLLRLKFISASNIAAVGVKKDKDFWYIRIKMPASMLESSIKDFRLPFPIKGYILAEAKMRVGNKQLIIKKISVRGPIDIDAQGYVKNYHLRLNGKIKLDGMEQNFNFDQSL